MNKDVMRLFFPREVELVEAGKCPICCAAIKIESFRDEISLREYKISGMCQKCQDKFFGGASGR